MWPRGAASAIVVRSVVLPASCAHFQLRTQKKGTTDFTDDTDKCFRIRVIREIRGHSVFWLRPKAELVHCKSLPDDPPSDDTAFRPSPQGCSLGQRAVNVERKPALYLGETMIESPAVRSRMNRTLSASCDQPAPMNPPRVGTTSMIRSRDTFRWLWPSRTMSSVSVIS
jgi:hypothetical protein